MQQNDLNNIIQQCLADVKVELLQEFDENFNRKAFFSEKWQRKKFDNKKELLVDSGHLRQSVKAEIKKDSVEFYSELPYAGTHNDGGTIRVTMKMKKYFWRQYMLAKEKFGRKKNGTLRQDKRNEALSSDATFYKAMALKKVGSLLVIPRRRFIGTSPEVEKIVNDIIETNLTEYFNSKDFNLDIKK